MFVYIGGIVMDWDNGVVAMMIMELLNYEI